MRLVGVSLFTVIAAAACAGSAAAEGAGAPEPQLNIRNYRVEGNSVLPRLEIERAVYPFLGPNRTPADVEAARAALEKAYRDKGYETVGVEIPEQDVRGGVVRFSVTELKVGRLRVTGSKHFSPEDIKARAPSLAEGVTPNYPKVYAELAALNRSADRAVTPTLRAGEAPGTVDVDLDVEDRLPVRAQLELNDRYSSRTKRLRLSGSVAYANLFQREHNLSLQAQVTPESPDESWVLSGSYVAPLQGTPFTVVAYGVRTNSDVTAVNSIGVVGAGTIVGLRGIWALPGKKVSHQLIAGVDYKSFDEDLLLGADTAATPIDYFPLTLQYALAARGRNTDLELTLGLNFGVRGLDATDEEFAFKRFGAKANWRYLRADAALTHRLPWQMRLTTRISGQFSGEPLISNEQFGIGGVDSVRGYLESQALGDDGVSGQLELESPSLHSLTRGFAQDLRGFVFVDGGYVRIRDPLPDAEGRITADQSLYSAGVGLKARVLQHLNASVALAAPYRPETTETDFDNLRAHFRLWVEY